MKVYKKDRLPQIAKWIPIEKGVPDPEQEGQVLITVKGHYANIIFDNDIQLADYFGKGDWKISGYEGWKNPTVTAWMPLPTEYDPKEKTPEDAYPNSQLDNITIKREKQ